MPMVKCRRRDCISWEAGLCSRETITIDEVDGCLNFEEISDLLDGEDGIFWDEAHDDLEEIDSLAYYGDHIEWKDEGEEEEEESPFHLIDWDNEN